MLDRIIAAVKRPAKWARAATTRALHPRRRAAAIQRLEAEGPFPSVLFICLGNVCRSPYAEHAFRTSSGHDGTRSVEVDSAGFIGPGRASPAEAISVAEERSIDLTGHVSKVLDSALLERHELVVVMEPRQARRIRRLGPPKRTVLIVLGDLDTERPGRRSIRDPWGNDPTVFEGSFDRIDRCLGQLAPYVGPRPTEPATERGR